MALFDGPLNDFLLISHCKFSPIFYHIHLKLLFNMICVHGFVPDNFGHSVTVPVVEDKTKDM